MSAPTATASVEILSAHPANYLIDVYRYEAGELALMQRTIASLSKCWEAPELIRDIFRRKSVAQLVKVHAAHRAVVACLTGPDREAAPDACPET